MGIQISTPKTDQDLHDIQEVFFQTWLVTYPNKELGITREDIELQFKDRHSPETLEKRRQGLCNPPKERPFFIAKDGEKVVGVCRVNLHDDKNQLQAIYVLPECQGKGVGYKLWQHAQTFFDPKKPTIVQVATYNEQAINFYKKLGFIDTGKRLTEERHRMPISNTLIPEMEMVRNPQ